MKRIMMLSAGLLGCAIAARAADIGDPIFPVDMDNKARVELIYDHNYRNIDLTIGDHAEVKERLNNNVYFVRIHTDVAKQASLDFDVGGIEVTGGDFAFYGGVGVRMLAFDGETFRVSAEAQGHYAPSLGGTVGGVESDFDIWMADAALLLSAKIPFTEQVRIMPYAGPVLSLQRLDGESTTGSNEDVSAEEQQVLGGALGVSLLLPGKNSLRFEGRYFGASAELSIGAGIAF